MDIDLLDNLLFAMVRTGTPLLLVALGELVCERSGVLNLGQEGMMLFGAVIGFMVAFSSGSLWLGVLLAVLAGMLLAALFAGVALYLNANQVACGLALTIFGVGLSSFVGAAWVGKPLQGFAPLALPVLGELPLLGRMLFAQDALVYLSLALFAAVAGCSCAAAPGWFSRRSARTLTRPARWACRCCACAPWRCSSAAPWPAWPVPTCRWPTRRCGRRT